MKHTTLRHFAKAPVAWLVSLSLFGSLGASAIHAEELPTFSQVANPAPASTQPRATATRDDSGLATFKPAASSTVNGARPQPARAAAPVRRGQQDLLTFSPTTAASAAKAAPVRAPAKTAPQAAPKAAAPRVVEQQVHSVSALAQIALPPRMAARHGEGKRILGPSEAELRQTFNRAVEAAIERSPTIFRAKAEQQAAEADVDEAKGQRWPQVDVGTQTSPVKFGKGSRDQSGGGGVNLAVTTTVYDWGRTRNTINSRKHLAGAAEQSLAAERESTGYEVVYTMVELGKQRIIVDLSQQFADRMQDLVKMLAGIVAVDKGRSSELTQAKARLLQAHALRDAADAKARDAELTLRKLVGERPVAIPRTKEWNIRLANLDVSLEDAKEHPTIRQANEETESAVLQAKVVRASGLPQLNWVVSKSTAEDSLGQQQPWQTNLAVTWGAFRGGSTRAAERAALQRAEAGRYETDQQRRDLEYRIRTADHDARTLLERAELYRDLSVESSRIREDFFQQWHHLGRRTLLDVLSAENEHYGNQVNEINNRFDGYQAIVRQHAGAGTLARWLSVGN